MAKSKPVDMSLGDALPLGSRIRVRREALGIRLTHMACSLPPNGYDRGYISHVELDRVIPSQELVEKIAQFLGVSEAMLRTGSIQDLKNAPLPRRVVLQTRSSGGAYPPSRRSAGRRIDRILAMAHLAPEEEVLVAEHLANLATLEVALLREARALRFNP